MFTNSRSTQRRQPSITHGSRVSTPTQLGPPRWGTPARTSRLPSISLRPSPAPPQSVTTVEDDDMESVSSGVPLGSYEFGSEILMAGTFAKQAELSVFIHSHFPLEVIQSLKSTNLKEDNYAGYLDEATGFAIAISPDTSFVWSYTPSGGSSSTCFIFPNPSSDNPASAPLASLIPHSSSREPGLIIASRSGKARFWDSISTGLTGAERFQEIQIPLAAGEFFEDLYRYEPFFHIATTSAGRLFRLVVASTNGRAHLIASPFSKSGGVFSRVASSFLGSSISTGSKAVVDVAISSETSSPREVWALTERRLQRWRVSKDAWDQLLQDEDLHAMITSEIANRIYNYKTYGSELNLELLGISLQPQDKLAVLISFEENSRGSKGPVAYRSFAVVQLTNAGQALMVLGLDRMPYKQRLNESRIRPKLRLIGDGAVAIVQFDNAFSIVSLALGSAFRMSLSLKDPFDRIIAIGTPGKDEAGSSSPERNITIVVGSVGLLTCKLDIMKIKGATPDTPTDNLRSTMEQAIFFGSMGENPFKFSFEAKIEGDLDAAAVQLSQDILASRSELFRPTLDLRTQLADRKTRLKNLMQFIHENGAIGFTTQKTRERLANDAEKLAVADQLWEYHNQRAGSSQRLLVQAIANFMHARGEGDKEDVVRLFFRTHVHEIEIIFEELHTTSLGMSADYELGASGMQIIYDSCSILSQMYGTALRFRVSSKDFYHIDPHQPSICSWTSDVTQIKALQFFYEALVQCLREAVNSPEREPLEAQLRDFASILLSVYQSRFEYLKFVADSGGPPDHTAFLEHFQEVRPHILKALVDWGSASTAYVLAEECYDMEFLAELCHHPTYGNPAKIPKLLRTQGYAFALPLYKWYIKNGRLKELLESNKEFRHLLEAFFVQEEHSRIKWIHDLDVKNYKAAAVALEKESRVETRLDQKHYMLSISKLSALATFDDLGSEDAMNAVNDVNHELDWISVHQQLLAEFSAALESVADTGANLDAKVEAVASTSAAVLANNRPAFYQSFKRLAKRLLQGHALSNEDLADVMTLKDHFVQSQDFAHALQVVVASKDISEARLLSAVRSVWRRLLITDGWDAYRDTSSLTDEDLNNALRGTHLYSTILKLRSSIEEDASLAPKLIMKPSQVLESVPSHAELINRFPALTNAQVEGLETDYEVEADELRRLVGECEIESWWEKVALLVDRDVRNFGNSSR